MHIVYIHQHFATNEGTTGTRSYDVSRYLAKMGHKVTMICGIYDVSGLKPMPWYQLFRRERMDGFDVIVCNVPYSNHLNALGRMWTFFWFAVLASLAGLSARKPDVVFATHTPLTVGVPGYIVSRLRRKPFVFEVRDLWPEALVIAGELKPGPLLWFMSALEKFFYAKARKILLVSPGFEKRLLERGYPQEKLRTVLLGADGDLFLDRTPDPDFRRQHNLGDKMLAIFTGAHGWSNGLDYVLDAAERLKHRNDIAILFLGEGREKARLKQVAQDKGLTNVLFLDAVAKTGLPGIMMACDVGLMILLNVGERPVTPNKIFDYMFCGLPSIVNFGGSTLEMVERDGTGVGADPLNPGDLAAKLEHWADHPDERRRIGALARKIAYEKYARQAIAEQLAQTFEEVARRRKAR
ncbi:MAG: glycosyltransferase family 4 protein [Planctomycetota bacterium]|nr:glycosyltransferase family 4 protein [Planctomycetota bacterium]